MSGTAGSERALGRALLSVQDKTGLPELVRGLAEFGVELWATSGTRAALGGVDARVHPLEELTGVDAWFGGRVKTLHPAVFGGILAPRTTEGAAELERRSLRAFDLVAVNFYPFERHLAEDPAATDREEFVDIGGVSLVRAAAKNHDAVVVLSAPEDYPELLAELRSRGGRTSAAARRAWAVRAFARCSRYDAAIADGLQGASATPTGFPPGLWFERDAISLRYGENPHQKAAAYHVSGPSTLAGPGVGLEMLKGEPLSYTNLLDLDSACGIVDEFDEPAAAVVKHATPCGVAVGGSAAGAVAAAIATDPVARYGCAVAVNRPLDARVPEALHGVFVDLLAAPEIEPDARTALERRPKLKLVRVAHPADGAPPWEARSALGRLLVQEADRKRLDPASLRRVAGPELGAAEIASLGFAWNVVRHAKSNAIVLAQGSATVGVGSGQPTRVKAVELACEVAGPRAQGAFLASDAFFPFADGVEAAAKAGVKAILQPGGSLRDAEVIAAAERAGMSMYLTGWRVFRH